MHITLVNPNTTASMTEKIGLAARSVAAQSTDIQTINPTMGPVSIEGFYDEALALPGLLQELARAEHNGANAAIIACFDDCGLDAARSLLSIPVIGICEAAIRFASTIATRYSVVTTLPASVPAIIGLTRRYGVSEVCTVRAAGIPVLALEDPESGAVNAVRAAISQSISEDRAECIILGCAGMADLARDLSSEFHLPVIDGVISAVKFAEALAGLNLRTSKIGGYAAPSAKPYIGLLSRFSPQNVKS